MFPDDLVDSDERLMADALDRAAGRFAPHSPDLVQRAALRGRHLRRVRRAQLSAAALVLVVGGTALGITGLTGRDALHSTPAATGVAVPPSPPSPSVAAPSPSAAGALTGLISGQLAELLPIGSTVRNPRDLGLVKDGQLVGLGPQVPAITGAVDLTDDQGSGEVAVSLSYLNLAQLQDARQACRPLPTVVCETLQDGTVVSTEQLPPAHGTVNWRVDVYRSDGIKVDAVEFNAALTQGPPLKWSNPPLTMDELRAIALNAYWGK